MKGLLLLAASLAWILIRPSWASLPSPLGNPQSLSVSDGSAVYTFSNQFNGRNTDIQLWKSDSRGGLLWTQTYDLGRDESANTVAKDGKGNLYIVGHASQGLSSDFLILSYSPQGALRWTQNYALSPEESLIVAATDPEDNLYVVGSFRLGNHYALWTAKYGSLGNRLWDRTHDSGANSYPRNVYIAPLGDIVITFEEVQEQSVGKVFQTKTIMYNSLGQKTQ